MTKENRIQLKCKNCNGTMEVDSNKEVLKCPYCESKELIMESDYVKVEKYKFDTIKDIFINKEIRKEKQLEIDKFKKSKFSKILLIFAIICIVITFTKSFNFSSIISLIQSLLFIISWLMGMKIINEKFKGLHIVLALCAFILIIPFFKFNVNKEKLSFEGVILSQKLPLPHAKYGEVHSNFSNLLMFDVNECSMKDYQNYVNKVIEFGYDIDKTYENWDYFYEAFNKDGYLIRITYIEYSEEMSVSLESPRKFKDIVWPNTGLSKMLPKPKSSFGEINTNSSDSLIIYLGNMTINDFNDYVEECEKEGFIVDFEKDDKSYKAKNKAGFILNLKYIGANNIQISLDIPEYDLNENVTTTKTTSKKKTTTKKNDVSGLGKEFKKAMDDYESYMDEYVDFMKKYNNATSISLSMVNDYAKYMKSYSDVMESFEKWDDEDLNDKELDYYIKVQTRVNKKLAEIE